MQEVTGSIPVVSTRKSKSEPPGSDFSVQTQTFYAPKGMPTQPHYYIHVTTMAKGNAEFEFFCKNLAEKAEKFFLIHK